MTATKKLLQSSENSVLQTARKLEIELSHPLLKYEWGDADKRSQQLGLGCSILYYGDGHGRLVIQKLQEGTKNRYLPQLRIYKDVFENDNPILRRDLYGIIGQLQGVSFAALKSEYRNSLGPEDGNYQRLKLYSPESHEVVLKNYAFPKEMGPIISNIRAPFEEYLNGYPDVNAEWEEEGFSISFPKKTQ